MLFRRKSPQYPRPTNLPKARLENLGAGNIILKGSCGSFRAEAARSFVTQLMAAGESVLFVSFDGDEAAFAFFPEVAQAIGREDLNFTSFNKTYLADNLPPDQINRIVGWDQVGRSEGIFICVERSPIAENEEALERSMKLPGLLFDIIRDRQARGLSRLNIILHEPVARLSVNAKMPGRNGAEQERWITTHNIDMEDLVDALTSKELIGETALRTDYQARACRLIVCQNPSNGWDESWDAVFDSVVMMRTEGLTSGMQVNEAFVSRGIAEKVEIVVWSRPDGWTDGRRVMR